MNTTDVGPRFYFTAHRASLEEFAMDIINMNADLSSLLLDVQRHLSSLDLAPNHLLDEMLHLAEHVQHLQCEVVDASFFERNKSLRKTKDPLPAIYDKIYALCQFVKTASASASHYVNSVDDVANNLELCFGSLKSIIDEYGVLLTDLNDWIDAVEKVVPQADLPF